MLSIFFFFFNDTATTEIYTLSLHDALPIYGREAHGAAMKQLVRIFPDIRVHTPYPIQFGNGDWITVVTNATGTFTGEMTLPDDHEIPPTGNAFDLEFAQTSKWEDRKSTRL